MNPLHPSPFRAAALLFGCALVLPAAPAAQPEPPKTEEAVELPKMTVKGEPICSYGIAVAGTRESGTKKIKQLIIYAVSEGSEAERQGLKPGDEILSINGQKVAGMDGMMKAGSQLFDLLVDQRFGQKISIEVAVRTVRKLTLQADPDISAGLGTGPVNGHRP